MTIASTGNRIAYTGDGTSTVYYFPYLFFQEEDLVVLEYDPTTDTTTTHILNTDYTVTGMDSESGGYVTMTTAPIAGDIITIYRDPAETQDLALTQNGPLPVASLETQLDDQTMMIQRLRDLANRSLTLQDSDTAADMQLPMTQDRASQFLAFDDNGLPIAAQPSATGVPISSYMVPVVEATTGLAAKTSFGVPVVSVLDYGAVGNEIVDDTGAINAAIAECNTIIGNGDACCLLFPSTGVVGYKITSGISIPNGCDIQMDAEVLYVGTSNIAAVTIGNSSDNYGRQMKLNVRRQTQADWTSEACIGIKIINANYCDINIVSAQGFTKNVECNGNIGGFQLNNIRLGNVSYGKVGVDLNATNNGFVNENLFIGGNFNVTSPPCSNGTLHYGIRIWSADGTYNSNNNNQFIKPCIQLLKMQTTGTVVNTSASISAIPSTAGLFIGEELVWSYFPEGATIQSIDSGSQVTMSVAANGGSASNTTLRFIQAVAVNILGGNQNKFLGVRSEGNNATMWVQNACYDNEFEANYNDYECVALMRSSLANFFTDAHRKQVTWRQRSVFSISDLTNKAMTTGSSSGYLMVPGMGWKNTTDSSATVYLQSPAAVTMGSTYISIPNTMALGVNLALQTNPGNVQARKFIIDRPAAAHGGRVVVQCFNSSGSVIGSSDSDAPLVVPAFYLGETFSYTTNYGGAYVEAADDVGPLYFEVKSDVSSIWVGVQGGTSVAQLSDIYIYSVDEGGVAVTPGYTGKIWYERAASQLPTAGTFQTGDKAWNTTPGSGISGWVCTAGGTPGTWKPFSVAFTPTIQTFLAANYYTFTVSSATTTAGQTYTNNGHTFTVIYGISSNTTLVCSGTGAPSASGTLTYASGADTGNLTFSSVASNGTYQLPSGPAPLYIKVRAVGGGGGGSSSTSGGGDNAGGNGGATTFGSSLITANGGNGAAVPGSAPGTGGTASVTASGTVIQLAAVTGGSGCPGLTSSATTVNGFGGNGGASAFGGAGYGGVTQSVAPGAGVANTGGGGGGGGSGSTDSGGGGGGSGAYAEAIILSPNSTYAFAIGAGGAGGAAGDIAGAAGGVGQIIVEEFYQ